MANEWSRVTNETKNLFADPKYQRQAWQSVGRAILQNPASKPVTQSDKDGNETYGSMMERYSFNKLARDIKEIEKKDREPTELEMIMQCQIVKARHDTSAAVFVRDTLGAKPVDESKVQAQVSNPYEEMSDEELEMLAKYREEQAAKEKNNDNVREDNAES